MLGRHNVRRPAPNSLNSLAPGNLSCRAAQALCQVCAKSRATAGIEALDCRDDRQTSLALGFVGIDTFAVRVIARCLYSQREKHPEQTIESHALATLRAQDQVALFFGGECFGRHAQ